MINYSFMFCESQLAFYAFISSKLAIVFSNHIFQSKGVLMTATNPNGISILLIDDDEIDVRAFKRALAKQQIKHNLFTAKDGLEALDILRGTNLIPKINKPLLIFLDLNMPRMTGLQFLQTIRTDPELHDNIVFVLTTSNSEQDINLAYKNHVAGYLVKSQVGEQFEDVKRLVENYVTAIEFPRPTIRDSY